MKRHQAKKVRFCFGVGVLLKVLNVRAVGVHGPIAAIKLASQLGQNLDLCDEEIESNAQDLRHDLVLIENSMESRSLLMRGIERESSLRFA